jgi:hypothetical protein
MSVEREGLAKSLSKYVEKYAVSGAGDEWKTYFGEDLANEWLRVNIPATFTQAALDAAVANARLGALEDAAKAVCVYCRNEHRYVNSDENINPIPQKFENEEYVPNCGTVIGWQHHQSWGGFRKCRAAEINDCIAALRTTGRESA